jgi:hypothetical protein
MDDYEFDPVLRRELKQSIVDVLLKNGQHEAIAIEAGEMFVRLIESGLAQLSRTELLRKRSGSSGDERDGGAQP